MLSKFIEDWNSIRWPAGWVGTISDLQYQIGEMSNILLQVIYIVIGFVVLVVLLKVYNAVKRAIISLIQRLKGVEKNQRQNLASNSYRKIKKMIIIIFKKFIVKYFSNF